MPRQRMIKPEMWASEQINQLDLFQFKVFIGLISAADDEGRLKANPALIASYAFPISEDLELPVKIREAIIQMENIRDETDGSPLIGLYQIGKVPYIYHPKWHIHQKIPKSTKSKNSLPEPPKGRSYSEMRKDVTAFGYKLLDRIEDGTATETATASAAGTAPDTLGQRKKERKKE